MARAEIEAYNYGQLLAGLGVPLGDLFPDVLPDHPEVDRMAAARAMMRLGARKFNYWVRVGYHASQAAG